MDEEKNLIDREETADAEVKDDQVYPGIPKVYPGIPRYTQSSY